MPKYWFRQKEYGFGATPTTWQGWLLTLVSVGLVTLAVVEGEGMADRHQGFLIALGGAAAVLICFSWIAWLKTEGGWRWRWGKD